MEKKIAKNLIPTSEQHLRLPILQEEDIFLFDKYSNQSSGIIQLNNPENDASTKKTKYYRKKYTELKQELVALQTENKELKQENKASGKVKVILEETQSTKTEVVGADCSNIQEKQARKTKDLVILEEQILNDNAKPENNVYAKTLS